MNEKEQFIKIAGLICEPARARMLWSLLDGRIGFKPDLFYGLKKYLFYTVFNKSVR